MPRNILYTIGAAKTLECNQVDYESIDFGCSLVSFALELFKLTKDGKKRNPQRNVDSVLTSHQ